MGSHNHPIFKQFLTFLGLALLFLSACQPKINRFKNKQEHGLWVYYKDSTQTTFLTRGRFKNGVQVGKWIYNSPNGIKERTEVYRGKKIKIKHFHSNGKIQVKGKARIVVDQKKLHFYYYGPWYYYKEDGKLEKTVWFENGQRTKEIHRFNSGTQSYDSLNAELIQLDKDFTLAHDSLSRIANRSGNTSSDYLNFKKHVQQSDSLIYIRIEKIVSRFGYPEKIYTGDRNNVIFYIISFAHYSIKEKYLETFRIAAEKNDISVRDYAFFVDKYWLAKNGYQIYGTQYKFDKDYKQIFYPVKDLSGMNDRRINVGLEVVNLLEYKEYK